MSIFKRKPKNYSYLMNGVNELKDVVYFDQK